jgi:hypothetical protein
MRIVRQLMFAIALMMAAAGVTVGSSVILSTEAQACSNANFCRGWNAVCKRVCKGADCGTCGNLLSTCQQTGCFNFRSGSRCASNPGDVALTKTCGGRAAATFEDDAS